VHRPVVALAEDFLEPAPDTGAGRCNHTVLRELFPAYAKRPGRLRKPEVMLAGIAPPEDRRGLPVVTVCHGAEWLAEPGLSDFVPDWWFTPFREQTERAIREAACTIVPSVYTERAIVSGLGIAPERVAGIHYGVDLDVFRPTPGGRAHVAAALGRDMPYVLFVGVPNRAKQVLVLKDAMARLAANGLPHALVVVGGPTPLEDDEHWRKVGEELSGFPGRYLWMHKADSHLLARLYSEADVFCLPSIKESFGLPTLEAMACGTAVVVANACALPEVVDDVGVVCDPTVDAVAEALERVLRDDDLREDLSRRGLARAAGMTWKHAAARWGEALERARVLGPPSTA
jgi:glycosyltransferase involved in cell wall biosynthesis